MAGGCKIVKRRLTEIDKHQSASCPPPAVHEPLERREDNLVGQQSDHDDHNHDTDDNPDDRVKNGEA